MNLVHMLTKELKELARSYKLLFVPLIFVFLGVSQPVMIKLMPTLLKNAGNLPEGAVIDIPVPPPDQVLVQVLGQYNQLGILVLILVAMGSIAGERLSGVAATVLTKPVGRGEYLLAKALSYGLLAAASLALSNALAAYYTGVLIGPVHWGQIAAGTLLYLPNLLLAVAVALAFSTFMPSPLGAGGSALVTVIALNVAPKYMGKFFASIYPGKLTETAAHAMVAQEYSLLQPVAGVMTLTVLALLAGWMALRRQEL